MIIDNREAVKRRREHVAIGFLTVLLIAFLCLEYFLSRTHRGLPAGYSVLLFSLINLNVLIFLILIFFSFRNVAKIFLERGDPVEGTPLRRRLVMAFTLFATVPTLLLTATSVYYVYQSFEKWFSDRIASSFEKSLQVTQTYYDESRRRAAHWADLIIEGVEKNEGHLFAANQAEMEGFIRSQLALYDIDWVTVGVGYPPRLYTVWKDAFPGQSVTGLSQQEIEEARAAGHSQLISFHPGGELSRVTVWSKHSPFRELGLFASVGMQIPLLVSERTDSITLNLEDYQKLLPLQKTVKATFVLTLVGMMLVILFFSSWLGLHISRRLLKPLEDLTDATKNLAQRQWRPLEDQETFQEYRTLIRSFNDMASRVERAQRSLEEANLQLRETNVALEYKRSFLEILVTSVDFGVLALDTDRVCTLPIRLF
jgi:two-component system nitrogen regulation sensor histidine kinase NtrY